MNRLRALAAVLVLFSASASLAAITLVGVGAVAADAGGGAGTTPALPAGTAANDIFIAVVIDSSGGIPSVPAGWTRVESGTTSVLWERAVGGDTATHFPGGGFQKSVVLAYRGCLTTATPIDVAGAQNEIFAPGTNTVPAITAAAGTQILLVASASNGSISASSTAAPTNEVLSQSGSPPIGLLVNDGGPWAGGSTGTSAVTLGVGGGDSVAEHLSLLPAPAGSPATGQQTMTGFWGMNP